METCEGRYFGGDESQERLALVKDLRDAAWMTNKWLKEQGLTFIRRWIDAARLRPGNMKL